MIYMLYFTKFSFSFVKLYFTKNLHISLEWKPR
jgi:hypothetical protein